MRIVTAAALLAAFTATPAFAATPFDGGHIEAIGGYDSVHVLGSSYNGFAFGLAGGYDFRSGGAVFGVELEAADSTVSSGGISAGRDLYAGARVGAVVSPKTLLYAKVGYTNARANFGGTGINFDGIRVGAGVEFLIGGNFSIRSEYRYSNYQSGLSRNQGMVGIGFRF